MFGLVLSLSLWGLCGSSFISPPPPPRPPTKPQQISTTLCPRSPPPKAGVSWSLAASAPCSPKAGRLRTRPRGPWSPAGTPPLWAVPRETRIPSSWPPNRASLATFVRVCQTWMTLKRLRCERRPLMDLFFLRIKDRPICPHLYFCWLFLVFNIW